jgi:hypothetical protein
MKNATKSLLESLIDISPVKDFDLVIESRGIHIITSVITLLETITDTYGKNAANEMEKKICSSIRLKNVNKFSKGLKNIIKESRHERKTTK